MNGTPRFGRRTRAPLPAPARITVAVVAALCLTTLAAACAGTPRSAGSGGPSASATSGAVASASGATTGPLAMAACVRAHGVPDFPDPPADGAMPTVSTARGQLMANGVALRESGPTVKAAMNACRAVGGTNTSGPSNPHLQAEAVAAAQCMRAHGFPNFPDPSVRDNRVYVQLPSSIHASSAKFKAAEATCEAGIPPANR